MLAQPGGGQPNQTKSKCGKSGIPEPGVGYWGVKPTAGPRGKEVAGGAICGSGGSGRPTIAAHAAHLAKN